jgi:hypothetical protein
MCNIRRSGRPVYGTTTTNPTIWKGLLWLSHLHQNAQGSRLAGTKPFDFMCNFSNCRAYLIYENVHMFVNLKFPLSQMAQLFDYY